MSGAIAPPPAAVAAARLEGIGFRAGVAAILATFALLVGWNLAHSGWLDGYDAFHIVRYAEVVAKEHRLPTTADSAVWHNPPLFFAIAGEAQLLAERLGARTDPYKAGQAVSALAALAIVVLAFLTARELFPRSRAAQLGTLGFAATTPVLVRVATMYHPETLASALTAAAVFVIVRGVRRGPLTFGYAPTAGVLMGLASLTRTWALAPLAALALLVLAHAIRAPARRRAVRAAAAFVVAASALTAPWLAYKAIEFGSPLAFSRTVPEQWLPGLRPAEFYVDLAVGEVFSDPYQPHFVNRLFPVVYADWWGDYWRYHGLPEALRTEPERLPRESRSPRVLQSFVGIVPSLLMLAGVVGLTVSAIRRRSLALAAVVGTLVAIVAAFLYFVITEPKLDGDTIKSAYLLNAVAPLSVCGGWALAGARRAGRLAFWALLLVLADLVYLDLRFLVLAT